MKQEVYQFHLAIEPLASDSIALTVLQRPFPAEREGHSLPSMTRGRIDGLAVLSTQDLVLEVLRANEYKPAVLQTNKSKDLGLNEPGGVRLSVLFTALAPLANLDQIRVLQQTIWAMSDELLLYWFSLCYGAQGYRGADALRVLFGIEMISPS